MKRILLLLLLISSTVFGGKFLMPDEAFIPSASLQKDTINVKVDIGKDIYLYKDKFKLELVEPAGITIANLKLPETTDHDGDQIFASSPSVAVVLAKDADVSGTQAVTLKLSFQGCSAQGLCYEPMEKTFKFDVDTALLNGKGATVPTSEVTPTAQTQDVSETDQIVNLLKGDNIWLVLVAFFGIGVALSLTPCIFPMIPILSSIIASQGEGLSTKRGFMLALVYVLAMAIAYTIAGVLAGIFGANLQVMLQNPIAITLFALIFVALAFSMFGFYEIGLPASIQSKLNSVSDSAGERGGFLSVAIMGFLSALIVGPCVAPGLAGALIYIGQSGDAILGGAALFVMSIGMGLPLLVIGAGAGTFMPKPGGWMNKVTIVFGVVMLGIAIWMLSRILPDAITMLLWALFFIGSAVYMGAFEALEVGKRSWNALTKTVAMIFFIYGTLLFVGALSGASSMVAPLEKFTGATVVQAGAAPKEENFKVIHSLAELDAILAKSKGKRVMLDFSAEWCSACKEFKEITFKDANVKAKMGEFVLVQADVTKNSDDEKALTKHFGLFGPPGIIFFDANGKKISGKTVVGYQPPEKFLAHLNSL